MNYLQFPNYHSSNKSIKENKVNLPQTLNSYKRSHCILLKITKSLKESNLFNALEKKVNKLKGAKP